jgi:exosome complex protein LRP1
MEAADLLPLLEQLDDNVDDLEEALRPILESSVSETSNKLPVLDKAKFHVLVTYALESLIFCTALWLISIFSNVLME